MFSIKTLAMGVTAAAATIVLAQPASAYVFTLNNDNGGDGFVTGVTANGFDLFGSDNGSGANTTSYLATATSTKLVRADWTYTTADCCGSFFDPAGYYLSSLGSPQMQLSPDSSAPGFSGSGSFYLTLNPGDVFGFYVATADGELGRADIAVTLTAVPEPATWALMIGGFGMAGYALRRRKLVAA